MRTFLAFAIIAVLAGSALAEVMPLAGPSVALNGAGTAVARGDIVYDNTATVLGAYSSTNLQFVWGDDPVLTAGGILDDFTLSIFNSSSSAGPLLTATIAVEFYDNADPANPVDLGGFSGDVEWTGGLAQGYYSAVSWSDLSMLETPIELPTNVLVLQQVTALTGTASKLGVVYAYPPTVGTSAAGFYTNGTWTTTNGGFYQIGVIPEPASIILLALGGLLLRRR
jgi:hypothetical protein